MKTDYPAFLKGREGPNKFQNSQFQASSATPNYKMTNPTSTKHGRKAKACKILEFNKGERNNQGLQFKTSNLANLISPDLNDFEKRVIKT